MGSDYCLVAAVVGGILPYLEERNDTMAAPLPLPKQWDENEWFILGSHFIGIVAVAMLPKRFPYAVTMLIFIFCVLIVRGVEDLIAGSPFDYYDISDTREYELMDLLVYFLYCYYGYFYLYIYDIMYNQSWFRSWLNGLHVIAWLGISIAVEWVSVMFHVYHYKGWKLIYSMSVYAMVLGVTMLFYYFLRWRYPAFAEKYGKHPFPKKRGD